MNELREEIELPALSNYSLENMRNASDEMQREAFQGFFLLAKREREAHLKSSLAANREQKAEIADRDNHIDLAYKALGDVNRSVYLFDHIQDLKAEIERLKQHLTVVQHVGVKLMKPPSAGKIKPHS